MRSIARRTAVGAALLLVMPVAVWISGVGNLENKVGY
mgnify:CR=1 FL=1